MESDMKLTAEFERGRIYEYRGSFVYVPSGTTDRVTADVETDEEAVRVAVGVNLPC